MVDIKDILLLGNPLLHQASEEVKEEELQGMIPVIKRMYRLIQAFRQVYGFGRAIAAPQVGVLKRMIVKNGPEELSQVFFNPVITERSEETMTLWDNCMSFPQLFVRLRRHKGIRLVYRDITWEEKSIWLEDGEAELLQHEIDHLDGILAIDHARDSRDFKWVPPSSAY